MNQQQIESLHRLEAGGSVRVMISQETFDDTVKETMDDFDMSFAEALQETIDQFSLQGVDLRNIKQDNPADRVNVSAGVKAACEALRAGVLATEAAPLTKVEGSEEEVRLVTNDVKAATLSALADLLAEANISDERRSAAGDEGAIGILSAVLTWMTRDKEITCATFDALQSLFKLHQNREAAAGCCNPTSGAVMNALAHHINDDLVQEKGMAAVRMSMTKFEWMKNTFDESGIIDLLVTVLKAHSDKPKVCKITCTVMRQLVLRDDLGEQTDQCFDRSLLLNQKKALQEACTVLRNYQNNIEIVPVVLSTLACAALNQSNVDALVRCGVRDIALDIFKENPEHTGLVRDACFILGSLSMLDEQKKIIGQGEGMALIISAMDRHRSDKGVLSKSLKAIAVLTLRMPINATRLAETGSMPLILDIMRGNMDKPALQASCLTLIRNVVARNQELVATLKDEGVEELVRRASGLPGCNELAFAALRDLHCDVTFKEEWKGDIGYEKRLAQGDGKVEDPDFKNLMKQTRDDMNEATGLARFAA